MALTGVSLINDKQIIAANVSVAYYTNSNYTLNLK